MSGLLAKTWGVLEERRGKWRKVLLDDCKTCNGRVSDREREEMKRGLMTYSSLASSICCRMKGIGTSRRAGFDLAISSVVTTQGGYGN